MAFGESPLCKEAKENMSFYIFLFKHFRDRTQLAHLPNSNTLNTLFETGRNVNHEVKQIYSTCCLNDVENEFQFGLFTVL